MGASFCGYDTTVSVGAILALAQKVKSDFEKAGISVNIENMKPYFKTCVRSSDTTHWGLVLLIPKDKLSHIDGSKLEKYNLDYDTSMFPGSL